MKKQIRNLKRRFEKNGHTYGSVGRAARLSKRTVWKVLNDPTADPRMSTLEKLERVLTA
jgi:hypothetical protein